jgi:hypothetical protein
MPSFQLPHPATGFVGKEESVANFYKANEWENFCELTTSTLIEAPNGD